MISFLPAVRTAIIEEDQVAAFDPQGLTFFNINTPEDLRTAERMADSTRASAEDS